MLHLLYILAFTTIAFFAVGNLVRSLISVSSDSQLGGSRDRRRYNTNRGVQQQEMTPHPELLDEDGRPIDEPLLVMRSVNVEDARSKLDALYENSPGANPSAEEEK